VGPGQGGEPKFSWGKSEEERGGEKTRRGGKVKSKGEGKRLCEQRKEGTEYPSEGKVM